MKKLLLALVIAAFSQTPALSQTVSGNASLSVTTSSARVALPAWSTNFPYVLIVPTTSSTGEVFYNTGTATIVAATTNPALPSGGLCLNLSSSVTYLAAITASSTATLRITRLSACPLFQASNGSGGGGSGGAITMASGAVASGAYSAGSLASGAGADGWDSTQGSTSDAAASAGGTGTVSAKLRLATSLLNSIVSQTAGIAQGTTTSGLLGSLILCNNTTSAAGGSNGTSNAINCDLNGALRNDFSYLGGTAVDTNSGNKSAGTQRVVIATDQPALTTPMPVAPSASATGGASQYHLIAANTNNSTSVKGSAGQVYSAQLSGIGSAPAYLKFYDKATAPTCGTDTPVKVLMIPAASTAANGGGSNVSMPVGANFTLGIGICVVTGIADNDNTAVAAATFNINFNYK